MHMYEYEYADKTDTQIKQRMNRHHNSNKYSASLNGDITGNPARDKTGETLQGINNKPSKESNPTTRLKSLRRGRYYLGEIHKSIF